MLTPEDQIVLGWKAWYTDGTVATCKSWEDEKDAPRDGLLVRMLYYQNGGRQIQQGCELYMVAKHHSGELVILANSDPLHANRKRYGEDMLVTRGQWAPDSYYRKICCEAADSKWEG